MRGAWGGYAAAAVLVISVCLLALGATSAGAHRVKKPVDDLVADELTEKQFRAYETATLGSQHAAEHAAQRRAARLEALTDAGSLAVTAAGPEAAALLAPAGPPSVVGEWTEAPFPIPTFAINTVMLPTGKVLFWGRLPSPGAGLARPNVGIAKLWSPWLGTGPGSFQDVAPPVIDVDGPGGQPPGPAPIFCSGQSLLPSGEVLVGGGNLVYANTDPNDAYTEFAGLTTIFTFDPFSETWTQQPDLGDGRWYPSQVLLPDGRSIVSSGFKDDPPGGVGTDSLEVFNPPPTIGGQGTVEQKPSADRNLTNYPHLLSLRNGDAILAGQQASEGAILDTGTFTWDESLPNLSSTREKSNIVRRPIGPAGSDTFTLIGGYNRGDGAPEPFHPATNTTETIDAGQANPSWSPDAPLNVARSNANTVLLPDGSMVAIGGGSGFGPGNQVTSSDRRERQTEVYDPASNSWLPGPSQLEDRAYHSTAVLLPDGRVFSAGDDYHKREPDGSASQSDTAEIYSPAYLFKGPRPVIDSAPQAVDWGDTFAISSTSSDLARAVLVAPGAATHAFDMHQRHVELEVVTKLDGQGVNVVAPPSAGVAPPGYYMLFLLDETGVPSVASWVKIDPAAADQPVFRAPRSADFNGDGFADLATGAPLEDIGPASDAGAVNVIYGTASGLADGGNQLWHQDSLGGAEPAEANDQFGAALAAGDFNSDGFTDLAIGVPLENTAASADAGAVNVLFGSASGLTATGNQLWHQNSPGVADSAETDDHFGTALASGDLNGDARDDLAVGVSAEKLGTNTGAGAVNAIYGSAAGLSATGNQLWNQNSTGIGDSPEPGDAFGAAVATGYVNGDDRADLAVGVPSESVGSTAGAGAVNAIYGSAGGLSATGNQVWHQNSTGIGDSPETGDAFGAAVATGDLNGDDRADLTVGVRSESVGSTAGAGAVNAIYGSAAGLSATGNQVWHQNSTGIAESPETGDAFGAAVATGDLNGDGRADLTVGVPSESVEGKAGVGAVNAIYGSAAGLSATGSQLWHQSSTNIAESTETGDAFGAAVATGDLNGDGRADLAVGVPAESVGTIAGAGAVNAIYGSAAGLSATGNQLWNQNSINILDLAEAGDRFGAALAGLP